MTRTTCLSLALSLVLAVIATCGSASAADPASSWGVVDMVRVAAEYQQMHELEQQFQQFQRGQEEVLETRYKTRALQDAERQEYLDLMQMGAPTEDREKRLSELSKLSDDRERRLTELRQNQQRTPEEEEEYLEIKAVYDQRMAELSGLQLELQRARQAKQEELTRLLTDSVDSAVKAVAEEQQLAIVLRREVVLYGGTDITDDVLAKLNAQQPAETEEEPEE